MPALRSIHASTLRLFNPSTPDKMIKDVLTKIGGVGVYGVISICLFFTFFVVASIWALRLKKSYVKSMRELPLNDDCAPPNQNPNTDSEKN
jgi:hypothetical protein